MRKLILSLLAVALLLGSCTKKANITGDFNTPNFDGELVYISITEDVFQAEFKVIDSAKVKDGKFALSPKLGEKPILAVVSLGKVGPSFVPNNDIMTITSIVLEEGTIAISFGKDNATVTGTKRNEDYTKLQTVLDEANVFYGEAMKKFSVEKPSKEEEKAFKEKFEALVNNHREANLSFIKDNMDNNVGQALFASSINGIPEEKVHELIGLADEAFQNKTQIKEHQKMLTDRAEKNNQFLNKPYLDVELEDINGKQVKLSDYVGKGNYVFLDFWASWCNPCLSEFPFLLDTYAKYKEANFEIVGISMDKDLASWKLAVKEFELPWIQTNDKIGNATTDYAIDAIPFTLLVNPEGLVIEANLRGNALANKLEELLK